MLVFWSELVTWDISTTDIQDLSSIWWWIAENYEVIVLAYVTWPDKLNTWADRRFQNYLTFHFYVLCCQLESILLWILSFIQQNWRTCYSTSHSSWLPSLSLKLLTCILLPIIRNYMYSQHTNNFINVTH